MNAENDVDNSVLRSRDGLLGRVWYYSACAADFEALENLGFRRNGDICEATVMSGAVAKAEAKGFKIDWTNAKGGA